ncbi:hypothetical protein POTOM_029955 [Populus tomentosa]|uniref:Cytochrome P450 n=1 Tax=Populus tomentosa TaxID=118781 RepID=A0A8X7ZM99_POPTO|nr:hypothetical protein POTOM_029955 [Populus tomentosa]
MHTGADLTKLKDLKQDKRGKGRKQLEITAKNEKRVIATGHNPKTLSIGFEENAFARAMDDACVAMLRRHILPGRCRKLLMWLQIGSEKRLSVAKGTIRQIVTNYMATKREELSAGAKTKEDEETFDVLRSFLTINDVDDKEHPDEIVRDITIGIIFAAYDTSSATLSWFFWLHSKNPHVETKTREELDSEGRSKLAAK